MSDYTELKGLAEALLASDDHADFPGWMAASDAFDNATGPAAILALIADNVRLKTSRSTTERDLAQELEVWRNGPSCWSCGDTGDVHDMVGEWRGKCDCNAAKLIDAASDRDQLKAENEALRAKLESPDPILIQSLDSAIADYEQLEKNAKRYQWLRDKSESIHQFYLSTPIWFTGVKFSKENVDSTIDAAMGEGDQL
jgi:hypothetical protein